jgi:hypothetical protein
MRKLALKLDDLMVQSFETLSARTGRGTVLARESETHDEAACAGATYASCETCESCDTCNACTQTVCDPTDTADPGRRIILY